MPGAATACVTSTRWEITWTWTELSANGAGLAAAGGGGTSGKSATGAEFAATGGVSTIAKIVKGGVPVGTCTTRGDVCFTRAAACVQTMRVSWAVPSMTSAPVATSSSQRSMGA